MYVYFKTSWFQEKFQEFETLRLDFRNKLSRSQQAFLPHDREKFRLFSEKNLTRLCYLLEFMTEHEAKFAVELSLSHLKTSIAYFEISQIRINVDIFQIRLNVEISHIRLNFEISQIFFEKLEKKYN